MSASACILNCSAQAGHELESQMRAYESKHLLGGNAHQSTVDAARFGANQSTNPTWQHEAVPL